MKAPGSAAKTTSVAYMHDATGALARKGDNYLHYGPDGRIAKAGLNADPKNALAVSYTYNALSQRVFKSDARLSGANNPAITTQTVYAEDGIDSTVLGQYGNRRSSNSAAPAGEMDSTEVIYLPTAGGPMPVAAQINGRLYAIDADHLNTPRRLTNTQGQVAWQWLITGFGEANPTTGATGYAQSGQGSANYSEAVKFDLRYPGQVWDDETGLAYNLNRYYDREGGRYIQADPIGLDGGWNRFAYVDGNPLLDIDPEGLQIKQNPAANMPLGQAGGGGAPPLPNFAVSSSGTAFPIPSGARGPVLVTNPAGKVTGSAFTGGAGGANGKVCTARFMDPTPPRGASPGYPNGYVKYENATGQGVDPYTGKTLPNSQSHFAK